MQTRRDQLQAYRFQNRRALAALVTGEPNVLEPPMRRLTVTTLSGIMIAILIAAGFALVGVFKPSAGDSWRDPGAVIVDQDTSAVYVYIDNTLHPVLNYTSAVLAVSGTQSVTRVSVSSSDISGARYGPEIGIRDVPSALPPSSALIGFPMSVCSTERKGSRGSTQALAAVTLHVGNSGGGRPVPSSQGIVVAAASNRGQEYLLTGGRRLPIATEVAGSLGLDTDAVPVGSAFLNAVPLGPALAPPRIPGAGTMTSYTVAGARQPIGRLVETDDSNSTYLVLADGLALVTPVEKAILTSNLPPLRVSTFEAGRARILRDRPAVLQPLEALPSQAPTIDEAATSREGVCVVYPDNGGTPRFTVPPGAALPDYLRTTVRESRTSLAGKADVVDVPATHAVLARPADGSSTVLVIGDQGLKYPFTSADLLQGFGYQDSAPTRVPSQLLSLIPYGGALSRTSALRPVTR